MYSKKVQNGWAFYDWANSVYSLVISTAIFPIYYTQVTVRDDRGYTTFLGFSLDADALYSFVLSASFLIVAFLSPALSGIADYTGAKKKFLKFFCTLGSLSCMGLYFYHGENVSTALLLSVSASIGFWGSLVFYNSYLPEIAPPEDQDKLSAKGFSLGYVGSSILLIGLLLMITFAEELGMTAGYATRVSFLITGLWWLGFAQVTFSILPKSEFKNSIDSKILMNGFKEIKKVFAFVKSDFVLSRFLAAFFFYSTGVQTIIVLASLFGAQELGLSSDKLILTILIIQFVAIAGAMMFSKISKRVGNFRALRMQVFIWIVVCVIAFLLRKEWAYVEVGFYVVGAMVGLVLGGIQSLSRSTYSKLLPEGIDTTSFFSFYDVTEKIAIVLGTLSFGLFIDLTGSMNWAALGLAVYFLAGWFLLKGLSMKGKGSVE